MAYLDWIKIEHTTPSKHEVMVIAELLGIDPDEAFGKLVRVWIWADQNTTEGKALNVSKSIIDRMVGKLGFADAMVHAGWLSFEGAVAVFPNFNTHNTITAKKRADGRKRVTSHRSKCNKNVTDSTQENVKHSPSIVSSLIRDESLREGNEPVNVAADMATEFHFRIPGLSKPTMQELAAQFEAKLAWLRNTGQDKTEQIWEAIRSPKRDLTEATTISKMFLFWRFCGLEEKKGQHRTVESKPGGPIHCPTMAREKAKIAAAKANPATPEQLAELRLARRRA